MTSPTDIDAALADDLAEALSRARSDALKPAEYAGLARRIRAEDDPDRPPLRLACLCSYSMGFIDPYLAVEGAGRGFRIETYFGGFGQFEQELLDPPPGLYAFRPDALVLALRPEDVDADAIVRFHESAGKRFGELVESLLSRIGDCIDSFRRHSTAPVFVANFASPARLPLRVFDANVAGSLTHALAAANRRLSEGFEGRAITWDYAGLVRERGSADWTDPRMFALARAPVAARHQPAVARHLARTLAGALRPRAKCLVLDLDNTLWGGVVGEDGLEGLALGDDHPGVVYKSFQRAVLSLRDRGLLLAVASKNDHEIAEAVFREHPEMLIRWDDLAAAKIHWGPKSSSLLEIAEELNIGADALVFFDDNPVERAEVRVNAPAVRVLEVPSSPLEFERVLFDCAELDAPTLTAEDAIRAESYRHEAQRRTLQRSAHSLEDFLRDLDMRATLGSVDATSSQRVVQLLAKTNQFNLTTRRHTAGDLDAMASDPDCSVRWLRLADRYGDSGLVAVGIVRREGTVAVIETLLMSCRVMGRGVEEALLSELVEQSRLWGCERLAGDYLPTEKNRVVEDFYTRVGFETERALEPNGVRYGVDTAQARVAWPKWIERASDEAGREVGPADR